MRASDFVMNVEHSDSIWSPSVFLLLTFVEVGPEEAHEFAQLSVASARRPRRHGGKLQQLLLCDGAALPVPR